jgi:hypothetical protein
MTHPKRSDSRRARVDHISARFLGPFSGAADRQAWEERVEELLQQASEPPTLPLKEQVLGMRRIARSGKVLSTEIRRAHPVVQIHLVRACGIDIAELADQLEQVIATIDGAADWLDESRRLEGRSRSWVPSCKEKLVKSAQVLLESRGRRAGLTRGGNLAEFAKEVWNCANGADVNAESFSYVIDHLQQEQRALKARLRTRSSGKIRAAKTTPTGNQSSNAQRMAAILKKLRERS